MTGFSGMTTLSDGACSSVGCRNKSVSMTNLSTNLGAAYSQGGEMTMDLTDVASFKKSPSGQVR